jgi:hypothetical protein
MSIAVTLLTAGASLGLGAVSAPAIGGLLSKPMTGEVVPTRLTDLAGYLTLSSPRGLLSFEDTEAEFSFGSPFPETIPTVPAPRPSGNRPPAVDNSNDQKRLLAVVSLGGGVAIAALSFVLIRRVLK